MLRLDFFLIEFSVNATTMSSICMYHRRMITRISRFGESSYSIELSCGIAGMLINEDLCSRLNTIIDRGDCGVRHYFNTPNPPPRGGGGGNGRRPSAADCIKEQRRRGRSTGSLSYPAPSLCPPRPPPGRRGLRRGGGQSGSCGHLAGGAGG